MGKANLYPGINPHLNSHLQHVEGWEDFHTCHLNEIRRKLEEILPGNYYARMVASHQTAQQYRTEYGKTLSSIGIVTIEQRIITLIEILTPWNKPPSAHSETYLRQREACVRSGVCLVEVDYLPDSKPVIRRIPSYPDRHPGAFPYSVIVANPRPRLEQGLIYVYGFGVLESLPIIDIPLDDGKTVQLNFGQVYNNTFSNYRVFYELFTDYTREPANFDAYSDADKALIREHMSKINKTPGSSA